MDFDKPYNSFRSVHKNIKFLHSYTPHGLKAQSERINEEENVNVNLSESCSLISLCEQCRVTSSPFPSTNRKTRKSKQNVKRL